MPLIPLGTPAAASVTFNSGYLSLNNVQVADVSNFKVVANSAHKTYSAQNSILFRAIRRSDFVATMTFDVEGGFSRALYSVFFSSSSPDTGGTLYTFNDGQQNVVTGLSLTIYENNGVNAYQYQPINPVITKYDVDLPQGTYSKVAVEIQMTNFNMFVSAGVAN